MSPLPASTRILVVGAGPAGLATGALLQRAGLDPLLLESAPQVAAAWRTRYDGFMLNTSRWFSHLPGAPLPKHEGFWPGRDAMVAYYEAFARDERLRILTGVTARRIDRDGTSLRVTTDRGSILAQQVVMATGNYREPEIPAWPGKDGFEGTLLHASTYRNAGPYRGRDVLVVGTGNTGVDVAVQLAKGGARRTRISVRTPPHLFMRTFMGLPADALLIALRPLPVRWVDVGARLLRKIDFGDLSAYGLKDPEDGARSRMEKFGRIPTIAGPFVQAVKAGLIEVVPAVERMEGPRVVLSGGETITPDTVIAATGYRRGLAPIVGHLGVLGPKERPLYQGGEINPRMSNLHFIGYNEPFSGPLREKRLEAKRIVRAIRRQMNA